MEASGHVTPELTRAISDHWCKKKKMNEKERLLARLLGVGTHELIDPTLEGEGF